MTTPFERRMALGGHGRKAEKKTAKRLGGNLTPASGALAGAKGDFSLSTYLVENKCTNSKSLSIKLDWLQKISREAVSESKTPALAIQFVDNNGKPLYCGNWVLIPEDDFEGRS